MKRREVLVAGAAGGAPPVVEVTARHAARPDDRFPDRETGGAVERRLHAQATELIPNDGIVKATARRITSPHRTDAAKARAIYGWVVDNTFRDAKVRGRGLGDIAVGDAKVVAARAALFGAREVNWMACNTAHDVKPPGSAAPPHASTSLGMRRPARRGRVIGLGGSPATAGAGKPVAPP